MKRLFIFLIGFMQFTNQVNAQQDTALINRLTQVLEFTHTMNLEKILDYIYPKLFTISPREEMLGYLKSTFESKEFIISADSLRIDTIYPVFKVDTESFCKIRHTMLLHMRFNEPIDSLDDGNEKVLMASIMEPKYGKGNVWYDKQDDALVIFMKPEVIAVKNDKDNTWYFMNIKKDDDLFLSLLFSQEVLDKLKDYQ
jgi:hypothetical protein